MRVYIITCNWGGGGPGSIVKDLYNVLASRGHIVRVGYGRGLIPPDINGFCFSDKVDICFHFIKSRLFDSEGFSSTRSTKRLLKDIHSFRPDVINVHNELGHILNVGILCKFFRKSGIRIFWTLHDAWLLTGHCITGLCDKVFLGCGKCPRKKEYPKSVFLDLSSKNYLKKKKMLLPMMDNLSFITPSKWLSSLLKKSYLSGYPVNVINNGIDLSVFKPIVSELKVRYNFENKFVFLSVAGIWSSFKGITYIYELSKIMDPNRYVFVVIGANQPRFMKNKKNILSLERTDDVRTLVEWYSCADVFLNPTVGDNFPTVNLESLACGTPVITFDTGGSSESVLGCGYVVKQKDVIAIKHIVEKGLIGKISIDSCLRKAQMYDKYSKFLKYAELFETSKRD